MTDIVHVPFNGDDVLYAEVDGEVARGAVPAHSRPYAPSHSPGNDPYLIREVGTDTDRRTSFRGEV